MPAETLFSMTTLLWVAGSLIAFSLLVSAMTNQRLSLTALLRAYVDKHQSKFKNSPVIASPKKPDGPASSATPPESPPDS